jgi:hypothetical protein
MKGIKMTTKSENEALGRIDERTKIMAEKLDKVEANTNALTGIVSKHSALLEGDNGLIRKVDLLSERVEKHDKFLYRVSGAIALLLVLWEILKELI